MAKIVCVLYDDPIDGYPKTYARDDCPQPKIYPDGQTLPTPKAIDFKPGALLGSVSGELGLRKFLESNGHQLVVTSSKDGADSVLDRELHDAEIVISQPFWPAYMTAERFAKAKKLKLIVTAGIGSDHTDLQAAIENNVTVAEVTYCNSHAVAEHVVMSILALVRNFIPSHDIILKGGWNIADAVSRSYDLEAMQVGTVAAGRIGLRVLRLLKPFDVGSALHGPASPAGGGGEGAEPHLPRESREPRQGLRRRYAELPVAPRNRAHDQREDAQVLQARRLPREHGARQAGRRRRSGAGVESGQIAGYAGDVWFPQPAPKDHPWRKMPHQAMTPHISGTSLSAQTRYAAGVREILECYFEGRPIRNEYLVVQGGKLAGVGAHSYSEGDATGGSEEAARFKKG